MKKLCLLAAASLASLASVQGQVLLSGGTYTQDFDSLAITGTANAWVNNSTLLGWYASQSTGTLGTYRADTGSGNAGALYSYGSSGSTERALGSIGSGTVGNLAYGLRLENDTGATLGGFEISYIGEQWRNGGNTSAQPLAFSYLISDSPITSSDATGTLSWTTVSALTFTSPTTGATAGTLNGNDAANQVSISGLLDGVSLAPGQELFIRWFDLNDTGNDHGLAIDNLSVNFTAVPEPSAYVLTGLGVAALVLLRFPRKRG